MSTIGWTADKRVTPKSRRIRVWFGSHAIVDQVALPELAAQYERAMRRRFPGLQVTNEPYGAHARRREDDQPA